MVERVCALARQLGIRQAFAKDLGHGEREAVGIVQRIVFGRAIIETENLFVKVTIKMEWLNSNVGSAKGSLQERPEVFNSLRVNRSTDVLSRMVDHLMDDSDSPAAHLYVEDSSV